MVLFKLEQFFHAFTSFSRITNMFVKYKVNVIMLQKCRSCHFFNQLTNFINIWKCERIVNINTGNQYVHLFGFIKLRLRAYDP
jgi:hypothetical protein